MGSARSVKLGLKLIRIRRARHVLGLKLPKAERRALNAKHRQPVAGHISLRSFPPWLIKNGRMPTSYALKTRASHHRLLVDTLRARLLARPRGLIPVWSRGVAAYAHAQQASTISIIPSTLDTAGQTFKDNVEQMSRVTQRFNDLHAKVAQGGPPAAREKHLARSKMLPRE